MRISTKGRYAIRLMVDLAENDTGEYIALKDVSARQGISVKYLEQIVRQLSNSGYLKSVRGPQGGYRLAKKPDKYTVGDILRITEGSMAPVACLDDEVNECPYYAQCSTINLWEGLYKKVNEYIDEITLEDVVNQHKAKSGMDYVI